MHTRPGASLMVTADEIAGIAIFASLGEAERQRIVPRRGRHQPPAGGIRRTRGRRAGVVRAARRPHRGGEARRRDRAGGRRAAAGRLLRRSADHAGRGVPGRVPRGGGVAGHATRGVRLPRSRRRRTRLRRGSGQARDPPDRRAGRVVGHRRPRRRGRSSSGSASTRRAPTCADSSIATRSATSG